MVAALADFVVRSADKKRQLLIVTHGKTGSSAEWAAQMRKNLYEHLSLPRTRFFLLALPDRFYLWKNALPQDLVPPDYSADSEVVLRHYADGLEKPISQLHDASLQILIRDWLDHVMYGDPAELTEQDDWLIKSGLCDTIRDGFIRIKR